jgi:outer membrane biosynthesis protein TonB
MIRNTIIVAVATALLLPSITARAEFAPRDTSDVRPTPTKHITTKIEHVPARVALVTAPKLTVDEVLTKINTIYMASLQRCYRKSLLADPSISGKVILQFQVDENGRVLMDEGSTKFDQCVAHAVVGWRFSAPASDRDAHFKISLVLQSF